MTLTRWHVGPWTARGTAPGEPLQPGRRRTPDELNFDIVGLARILGRRLSGPEELQVRLWQNELRPTHTRLCGVHTLADPANAELLAATAEKAFEWLQAQAPEGYRFVRTDAVYLEGGPALVVWEAPDGWVVGDAACRWAGPFETEAEASQALPEVQVQRATK
ncbi:hypothetical protein OG394_35930 [Kribbella sp. NBC_01245]|uniref:hypothetical protein n=1 Tax=Kribbella sp. NBC_01245 TaxID=2903578 RepID=UPI002E2B4BAB|nr:hypothetical protein [Kribbella sp. NBC_01245]